MENIKWISVEERLPQHENNVLAVLDGNVCVMSYSSIMKNGEKQRVWSYVYDGIDGEGIFDDDYYPSHWVDMPIYLGKERIILNKIESIIVRILASPFVFMIAFIEANKLLFKWVLLFLRYGANLVVFKEKTERTTLQDIYEKLVELEKGGKL